MAMGRDVGAVVPAAGKGTRLGGRQAKAFVPLSGTPLILHALRALQEAPAIGWIAVVVRPEDRAHMQRLVRRDHLTKVSAIVRGGTSRASSVVRGVDALPPDAQWVVIHDGARPCVTRRLIERTALHAKRYGAVACGLPASLTVKAVDGHQQVRLTLDREGLWFVQTPQAFRRDWLSETLARLRQARSNGAGADLMSQFPDDAALLEWAGFAVRMVPGDPLNIKVTTPEDVVLAEAILRSRPSCA
jgi:2-C-methyl-D-erythritol 4-phosphate cytidylyltransferase